MLRGSVTYYLVQDDLTVSTFDLINYLGSPQLVPQAVGTLRDIQLASTKILLEIDRVCKEHNLNYFVIDGTLLGAVRHKGFIPWDDDIDIAMPRADYERFLTLFNQVTEMPFLEAQLYTHSNGLWNLMKVVHKNLACAYVDIFPVDFRYDHLSLEEKKTFTLELQHALTEHIKTQSQWPSIAAYHESLKQVRDRIVPNLTPKDGIKPTVFLGLDFYHNYAKYSVFDYGDIFPLMPIEFEGHLINGVHDPDMVLTYIYGDYMRLPQTTHLHTIIDQITVEEMVKLKQFLRH